MLGKGLGRSKRDSQRTVSDSWIIARDGTSEGTRDWSKIGDLVGVAIGGFTKRMTGEEQRGTEAVRSMFSAARPSFYASENANRSATKRERPTGWIAEARTAPARGTEAVLPCFLPQGVCRKHRVDSEPADLFLRN
jgi:hypothetical protein